MCDVELYSPFMLVAGEGFIERPSMCASLVENQSLPITGESVQSCCFVNLDLSAECAPDAPNAATPTRPTRATRARSVDAACWSNESTHLVGQPAATHKEGHLSRAHSAECISYVSSSIPPAPIASPPSSPVAAITLWRDDLLAQAKALRLYLQRRALLNP